MRRRDEALWFNLPGVVAAWQPVAAPGPLLARYNQAHGGTNLYKAVDGVAPTWAGHTGWSFDGVAQYLYTGIIPTVQQWSMVARFTVTAATASFACPLAAYTYGPDENVFGWQTDYSSVTIQYHCSGSVLLSPQGSSGVYGIAGTLAYKNGISIGTIPAAGAVTTQIAFGRSGTSGARWCICDVAAAVIYARPLSAAEMWHTARQMAYCHVNPDWSAWGRRRRYYYAPSAAAGNVGIYGKRGAVALPGGVRIEAVQ